MVPTAPHDVWSADFKGEFRLGTGELCYPLTVVDRFSRFVLGIRCRPSTATAGARSVFERLFREHGLPAKILTDGGVPFASSTSPRRLSRLSVWFVKLGIEPILTQPSSPQQNGGHEQMHRVLKAETARPPAATGPLQQRRFTRFIREYNQERPHEGIGMKTPASLYQPSPRAHPRRLEDPCYAGHVETRRVRSHGEIKWQGGFLFVSEVLSGGLVGLEEVDDGLWSLSFGQVLLGRFVERDRKLHLL